MSKLMIGESLRYGSADTPTREGEVINSLAEIYGIPTPYVGMKVYCKETKKTYTITSLASENIGGVEVFNKVGTFEAEVKDITWDANSDMNDLTAAGVYNITGERTMTSEADHLPMMNRGGGNTIHARLEVLDSSIAPEGKSDDICVTQKLTLSNRVAGDGDVYIRTGRGASKEAITWEAWGKLQQNIEVGPVTTLDNLVDNGIYSGVYKYGSGIYDYETFVLVVINDYAIAGDNKKISQFKYAVALDGTVSYKSRLYSIKPGEEKARWDSNWLDINEGNINKAIENAITKIVDNAPEAFDTLREIADWIANDETGAVALANAISANTEAINTEVTRAKEAEASIRKNTLNIDKTGLEIVNNKLQFVKCSADNSQVIIDEIPAATTEKAGIMSAEDKKALDKATTDIKANAEAIIEEKARAEKHLATEIDKLKDGDTIVGQAREIHSRNGKNVTDSFLARTTAGSGTIGDGVATLKSVGGNIVKNLVDCNWDTFYSNGKSEISFDKGIAKAVISGIYQGLRKPALTFIAGHKYYISCFIYNKTDGKCWVQIQGVPGYGAVNVNMFSQSSQVFTATGVENAFIIITSSASGEFYATKPLLIDLTEMFGEAKANQMTKEECDRLFGSMDALPQGLSIANPTEFKSTGYNQADPNNVLVGKGIDNGAIVDKVGSNIAVVPCLPCKIGEGENNGYCVHGAFDEGAEMVYLTPLNPLEVEGELYMHKLAKDADKGTYVPQIRGYMLVEVPDATDLCVHFLWSEDRGRHDYEPYFESKVELPDIPQMSEWGLAGIQSSGTLACDEIDFVKGVYRKKVECVDLNKLTIKYYSSSQSTNYPFFTLSNVVGNIKNCYIADIYTSVSFTSLDIKELDDNTFFIGGGYIYLRDSTVTSADDLRAKIANKKLYYGLAEPIEYPLPKFNNNYTSSDYGVEQFDSVVPCNANNLYYMRSLAGETRNFLDRLMAGLGTSDATALADRILAVVNPVVEPVIEEEIEP